MFNLRMNAKEAANYVGLHYSTLAKMRMEGDGPAYLKLGRKVVYEKLTLDKWMDERTHSSTSEY